MSQQFRHTRSKSPGLRVKRNKKTAESNTVDTGHNQSHMKKRMLNMHHVYHRKLKGDRESMVKEQETIKNDRANLEKKKQTKFVEIKLRGNCN